MVQLLVDPRQNLGCASATVDASRLRRQELGYEASSNEYPASFGARRAQARPLELVQPPEQETKLASLHLLCALRNDHWVDPRTAVRARMGG